MFADLSDSSSGGYAVQISARRREKVTIFDLSEESLKAKSRRDKLFEAYLEE